MKRFCTIAALGTGLLAWSAPGAWAQTWVNARVLSSTPIVESVPVTQCAPAAYGPPAGGGAALGALLGGLIGSQLGHGSGHIAGAIAGTVGGAFVGNAVEAQQAGLDRCQTVYRQQVRAYDVRYAWGGRSYRTQLAQPPGAWIQVPLLEGDEPPLPPPAAYSGPVDPAVGVVTAPPAAGYPPADPPAYPDAYSDAPAPFTQPVGIPVVVQPAAPVWVAPLGLSLSVGGSWGHHRRGGGWAIGVGQGW